jgi:hypothetical protein
MKRLGSEVGNFGAIDGAASAFLLDFGDLCAIEFDKVGNACFVYRRVAREKIVPDFWAHGEFKTDRLKNRPLSEEWVRHIPGWEDKMQTVLARHGVRPQ